MSRRDPTLPRSDTDTLPEADLIARVQTDKDSAALLALVNRNTGIYFQVVNRYAAAYPNAVKANDLDDDKLFNIYQFILDFDPVRGKTLCGYIHDRTDYLCKGILRKDERNPVSAGAYLSSGAAPLDRDDDTYATNNGGHATLTDESPSAQVAEVANLDLGIEDIRRAAGEVCTDKRFARILTYRHFQPSHQVMSWREVAKKVKLSHEGCRKVYLHNLELVKAHLST